MAARPEKAALAHSGPGASEEAKGGVHTKKSKIASVLLTAAICFFAASCGTPAQQQSMPPASGEVESAAASSAVSLPAEEEPQAEEPEGEQQPVFDPEKREGKLAVYFLGLNDIGTDNGEAALIRFPDGGTMLVDTSFEKKSEDLMALLEKCGVEKIDHLLLTHYHTDHTGGVKRLCEELETGQIYLPECGGLSAGQVEGLPADAQVRYLKRGDVLEPAEGVKLEILNPEAGLEYPQGDLEKKEKSAFENNLSLVFRLLYGETSLLLTGDIYDEAESSLLQLYGDELKCDLIKVPHHGLSTSSSTRFMLKTAPEQAVIMSGKPSVSIYESWKSRAETYVTGAYGTVLVLSDGNTVTLETEHGDESNGVYG